MKSLAKAMLIVGVGSALLFAQNVEKNYNFNKKEKFEHKDCFGVDLNLTESQKSMLYQLKSELKTNMQYLKSNFQNPLKEALSDGSFNKAKYIEIMNNNHQKMVELKAKYEELKYNVLNDEQKKLLKERLDANNQGFCHMKGF